MVTKITQSAKANKAQNLSNKKILITAGPTWVPIDDVRVISNIATGQTGILLAEEADRQGAEVTLLLGPVYDNYSNRAIRIRRFKFFNDLKGVIIKELSLRKYDVIIHNAAVSDFKPRQFSGKIGSDRAYDLKLTPLPKIIRDIRRLAPKTKLVMFKLESAVSNKTLIQRAKLAQAKANADFVVANRVSPYCAFIIDKKGNMISVRSRIELAKKLLRIINLTPITYNL